MKYLPAVLLLVSTAHAAMASDPAFDRQVAPFLKQHCYSCHDANKAKAGFRVDELIADLTAPRMIDHWKEVLDRMNAGEMPPEKEPRPDIRQQTAVVGWINAKLREADLAAKNAGGQTPMRRLNRDEYANTIRDLLHLDEKFVRPLVEDLPGDGKAEGFDRLDVGLFFDQTQMERALLVAEKVAAKAIVDVGPPHTPTAQPKIAKRVFEAEDNARLQPPRGKKTAAAVSETPKAYTWRTDGVDIIQGYGSSGNTLGKKGSKFGRVHQCSLDDLVTQDGYYRVRVFAKEDTRGGAAGKFGLEYAQTPFLVVHEMPVDPSGVTEHTMFLRAGEPGMRRPLSLFWTDSREAIIANPEYDKLFRGKLRGDILKKIQEGIAAKADVSELEKQRADIEAKRGTIPERIWNPALDRNKLPVLHLDRVEVEGPIESEWPPKSHKALFFAGDTRADENYAREIFARFLPRAYRRPVTSTEVEKVVAIVRDAMQAKQMGFTDAMRLGLSRVLSSPGFWFIERESKPAPAYALASRLSYFLWSTMPDDELFSLAASGKLADKAVLSTQVDRLLKDPRSEQFVRNFGGQWLSVREFGSVEPANDYKNYDAALKAAGPEEAYAFVAEVLHHDLPVTNFIDSDFAVVNERLAKHYGIEGVSGEAFRRVALKPEHHRGGVLGMAGLLTYLADGTRTLPMRRGTWVLDNLFGDPPGNPPPNAGEIQPNTAGENLSVRERIEKHRNDETCASCHAKLDPYGLALENYDAIGMWRERANGEGFTGNKAPPIDPSGTLPNGKSFQTLEQYKALLLEQKDELARCLATKMLTYALSRPVGYTDHETVDGLVAELKKRDYRIQTLVKGIVLSPAFQTE